jgi:hypothetical protein
MLGFTTRLFASGHQEDAGLQQCRGGADLPPVPVVDLLDALVVAAVVENGEAVDDGEGDLLVGVLGRAGGGPGDGDPVEGPVGVVEVRGRRDRVEVGPERTAGRAAVQGLPQCGRFGVDAGDRGGELGVGRVERGADEQFGRAGAQAREVDRGDGLAGVGRAGRVFGVEEERRAADARGDAGDPQCASEEQAAVQ